MCSDPRPAPFTPLAVQAADPVPPTSTLASATVPRGSRRRRLWELSSHAHCPVLGLCLPLKTLRRLIDKTVGGCVVADDYALHSGAVADARTRTRTAEALQREFDQRHAGAVRLAGLAKDRDALMAWWREASVGPNLPGALWATLTHPRCDLWLEDSVLRDVHMLQHQIGAAERGDLERLQSLAKENAVLARELAAAQQRSTRVAQEQGRKIEQLQAQVLQLRAELIGRDTLVSQARESLADFERSVPHLRSRNELARQNEQSLERIRELERAVARERERAERAERAERDRQADARVQPVVVEALPAGPAAVALGDCAVLCVGGRAASVPVYRELVEGAGGRFLHHDGGDEDNVSQLDATLAAADLVICQAGCISHDAYWRVKDHCKRTGKQCVFVEQPSRSGLQRALQSLCGEPAEAGAPTRPVIPLRLRS
jgi:hypothetical protein